jgi:methylenetetrahydrofolate dehydrogenase (NADP+) / methenyltetrahydrofolate cyclohydrolase
MGARLIDGRGLAANLKEGLAAEVAGLRDAGVVPRLATVLVGSPAEAEVYERRVCSLAGELGYRYACERLSLDAEEAEVIATVGKLKEDPRVSGILVLKPLPNCEGERIIR